MASFDLAPLLAPRAIAVIGASADLSRIGGAPIKLLLGSGFPKVYAVNPKYREIEGIACYPDIAAIPGDIDLVIIATGVPTVLDQLERAHRKGARAAVVFASGFAETGEPEGIALQAAMAGFAERTGMAIAGPNCLGIVNWGKGVFATFSRVFDPAAAPGSTALLGQSGNICSTIYRLARNMNLGFGYAINTGNEACLDFSDYLDFLAEDAGTASVLCYVEALRNGPAFLAAARRLREQGKLLAVYKAGSSEKGAEAAQSHTAALAGSGAAYAAAFADCGVAVAQDLSHLADLAYMHARGKPGLGRGVGIISVSGAAGAILADGLTAGELAVPTLPTSVQTEIRKVIPAYGMSANPVDLTGNAANRTADLASVVEQVLSADGIHVLFLYLGAGSLRQGLPQLGRLAAQSGKLLIVIDAFETGLRGDVERLGMAYFEDIARAVRALTTYVKWQGGAAAQRMVAAARPTRDGARRILQASGSGTLSEVAAKSVLAESGVPVVRDSVVQDARAAVAAAAAIGYPVVLKLVSADIAHKTEIGGVRLGLVDAAGVEAAYSAMLASARTAVPDARIMGVAIEPMIEGGRELLVGMTRDPVFGWIMTVGFGGTWAELIGDVASALLPVNAAAAALLLRRLKTYPLLSGFRGEPAADIAAACQAIDALSAMVLDLGDLLGDCEVNPLIVLPAGRGVLAVDALMTLAPTAASLSDSVGGQTRHPAMT